jgi:hypothetical protein
MNVPAPDSMPNTIPVFAYGTLKRGHGNHRHLEDATFLGEAVTAASYALHVDGLPIFEQRQRCPQPDLSCPIVLPVV